MRNLLNFFFAAALVLLTFHSSSAQVRFGIKAGLNLASLTYSDDYLSANEDLLGGDIKTGIIPAFHAGGQAEFGLAGALGLSAGVQLSVKGGDIEATGTLFGQNYTATSTIRPMYLQVPVALTYRSSGFYAGVGPYVGFGIGGKSKTKAEAGGQTEEDSDAIEFGNDAQDTFAPLDFGAGLELGYEFGSIRLSASYNLGLANVVPKDGVDAGKDANLDYKYRHNVIGVSVAYLFGSQ